MKGAKLFITLLLCFSLTACIGTAIGVATDAAIAVAKVPFKVVGAVIGSDGKKENNMREADQEN